MPFLLWQYSYRLLPLMHGTVVGETSLPHRSKTFPRNKLESARAILITEVQHDEQLSAEKLGLLINKQNKN